MTPDAVLPSRSLDARAMAVQLELDLGGSIRPRVTVALPVERSAAGRLEPRRSERIQVEGSTEDAAAILGVSRQTVRMMCLEGRLRHWKVGRSIRCDLVHAQEIKDASAGGPR